MKRFFVIYVFLFLFSFFSSLLSMREGVRGIGGVRKDSTNVKVQEVIDKEDGRIKDICNSILEKAGLGKIKNWLWKSEEEENEEDVVKSVNFNEKGCNQKDEKENSLVKSFQQCLNIQDKSKGEVERFGSDQDRQKFWQLMCNKSGKIYPIKRSNFIDLPEASFWWLNSYIDFNNKSLMNSGYGIWHIVASQDDFFKAICAGDVEGLRQFLSGSIKLHKDKRYYDKKTRVILIGEIASDELVPSSLMVATPYISVYYFSLLQAAVLLFKDSIVDLLLSNKDWASLSYSNRAGYNVLHIAALVNNGLAISKILDLVDNYKRDISRNKRGHKGRGREDKILDINAVTVDGHTPLMLAAMYDNHICFELLLSHGADFKVVDKNGNNVVHYLAFYNSFYSMSCLLQYLKREKKLSYKEIINFFNIPNNDGYTPLMCAIKKSLPSLQVMEFLLRFGVDYKFRNNKGETALTIIEDLISRFENGEFLVWKTLNNNYLTPYDIKLWYCLGLSARYLYQRQYLCQGQYLFYEEQYKRQSADYLEKAKQDLDALKEEVFTLVSSIPRKNPTYATDIEIQEQESLREAIEINLKNICWSHLWLDEDEVEQKEQGRKQGRGKKKKKKKKNKKNKKKNGNNNNGTNGFWMMAGNDSAISERGDDVSVSSKIPVDENLMLVDEREELVKKYKTLLEKVKLLLAEKKQKILHLSDEIKSKELKRDCLKNKLDSALANFASLNENIQAFIVVCQQELELLEAFMEKVNAGNGYEAFKGFLCQLSSDLVGENSSEVKIDRIATNLTSEQRQILKRYKKLLNEILPVVYEDNFKVGKNETLFHLWVRYPYFAKDAIEYFIDAGFDLDKENMDGMTALQLALVKGNFKLAEFLVGKGASVVDLKWDDKILRFVCENLLDLRQIDKFSFSQIGLYREKLVQFLKRHNPNFKGAVVIAFDKNYYSAWLDYLEENNISLNMLDRDGFALVHYVAIFDFDLILLPLLIQRGVDFDLLDKYKRSLWELALLVKNENVITFLENYFQKGSGISKKRSITFRERKNGNGVVNFKGTEVCNDFRSKIGECFFSGDGATMIFNEFPRVRKAKLCLCDKTDATCVSEVYFDLIKFCKKRRKLQKENVNGEEKRGNYAYVDDDDKMVLVDFDLNEDDLKFNKKWGAVYDKLLSCPYGKVGKKKKVKMLPPKNAADFAWQLNPIQAEWVDLGNGRFFEEYKIFNAPLGISTKE